MVVRVSEVLVDFHQSSRSKGKALKGTAESGELTDVSRTGATREGFSYSDHGTHFGSLFYWGLMGSISNRRGRASLVRPVKLMKRALNCKAWGIIKRIIRLWGYDLIGIMKMLEG